MLGKHSPTEPHPVSLSLFSHYPPLECLTIAGGGEEKCAGELRNPAVFPSEDRHYNGDQDCVTVAFLLIRQIEWRETSNKCCGLEGWLGSCPLSES